MQPIACKHAIASIRKFYKDAPIFLFNDALHKEIAKPFKSVFARHNSW